MLKFSTDINLIIEEVQRLQDERSEKMIEFQMFVEIMQNIGKKYDKVSNVRK
jgi:hypothetical protein